MGENFIDGRITHESRDAQHFVDGEAHGESGLRLAVPVCRARIDRQASRHGREMSHGGAKLLAFLDTGNASTHAVKGLDVDRLGI